MRKGVEKKHNRKELEEEIVWKEEEEWRKGGLMEEKPLTMTIRPLRRVD